MSPLARLMALLTILASIVAAAPARAQQDALSREVIRDYWVLVEVARDGSVTVSEEIEVVALGDEIRRGIFRDIPLGGIGALNFGAADFRLISAQRDNRSEPHHIEENWGSVRVYLGAENVLLDPGVYRYRLVYRMSGQVGRFADFDEIYWNATGNDWIFDIEKVRVTIVPPDGARARQVAAYTGKSGEAGSDVRISRDEAGRPVFTTTRPLRPGEGLTVAAGWPKGYVLDAGPDERFHRFLRDHGGLAVAGLAVGLVLLYYALAWWRVGRDPPPGTIIPIYQPELPPAAMRFIRRMRLDDIGLSSVIVSLAVKGHLTIREVLGKPVLWRAEAGRLKKPMSKGEEIVFDSLLGVRDRVRVDDADQPVLASAFAALERHFKATFNRQYLRHNYHWFAGGVAITLLAWLASAAISLDQLLALFAAVFPTFLIVAVVSLGSATLTHFRHFRLGGAPIHLLGIIMHLPLALLFLGVLIVVSTLLLGDLGWLTLLCLSGVAALNLAFYHLLKAPTAIGRRALDEIEGTLLYLTVAEADRLKFHNPPDQTPEHFHELLPYAIALDVETEWTNQFSRAIEEARARGEDKRYLDPAWYSGSTPGGSIVSVHGLGNIGSSLGKAISAATAPRAVSSGAGGGGGSSGSSGGGSSGGGGGGGGGGGW